MPGKDGLEIIQDVKEKFPTVKIVAMSGGGRIAGTTYLKYAETFGSLSTLKKPFTTDQLIAVIKSVLSK